MDNSIAKQEKIMTKMAEGKLAWIIINWLGWPLTVLSFLGNFEEPYKTVISIFTMLFLGTVVVRSIVKLLDAWEIYRSKKIANDEKIYLRDKRNRHQNRQVNP